VASVQAAASHRLTWLPASVGRVRSVRLPFLPLGILVVLVVCAVFAPVLAPHDPTSLNILASRLSPGEDWTYPLGTDMLGRDMLSRLIYGARTSALISLVALATGALLGTILGLISGHKGGWLDALIMRGADVTLGFPTVLVAMVIVVLWGTGIASIILAVALTVWARFARMIRGDVLSIKELDFVTAARIAGLSTPIILFRHIFPGTVNTLMVITSLQVGQVILLEASLSFLGLGLPPGAPSWGIMVAEGRTEILSVWWLSLLPGLVITTVVLAFNFLGDWLRDRLDPKMRHI
jgi:peptide/nickel transport system permease protein